MIRIFQRFGQPLYSIFMVNKLLDAVKVNGVLHVKERGR